MQNKKLIIAIVLGIGAVFSVFYGVTSKPKARSHAGSAISAAAPEEPGPAGSVAAVKRLAKRSQFASWARSPFVHKSSGGGVTLVLNGIVGSPKNPKAMIGDAVVGKGDKLGVYTVVDIGQNKVILNDGSKDIELKMEQ